MRLQRIWVLLGKEAKQGLHNFFFIFAIIIPVVLTLVISLVFGTLFADKPKLAVVDHGNSQMVADFQSMNSIVLNQFTDEDEMIASVEMGANDMGLILPSNFDQQVKANQLAKLTAYIWGESLLKQRAVLGTALLNTLRELAGQEPPLKLETVLVGDQVGLTVEERLFPLLILLSVMLGGLLIPASSLVDEKQNRTLKAITTTPASLGDVWIAKGTIGFIISVVMAIFILIMNNAFGHQPLLLVLCLSLAALIATQFGLIMGALVNDTETLFAIIKGLGIIIYAPGIIYMFPNLPQWIAKVFPTYYMMNPIVELGKGGAGWPQISLDVYVMIGIAAVLFGLLAFLARRVRYRVG